MAGPFDFLLQGKGVEPINPLDTAIKGTTLAELLQKVEGGALGLEGQRQQVQMQKDPRFWNLYSNALNLGGGTGGALGGGGGGGGAPGGLDLSFLSGYPNAAGGELAKLLKARLEASQIKENTSKAANYDQDITTARLKKVASAAAAMAQNPTPQNIQGYVQAHAFSGATPDFWGDTPSSMDPKAWAQYGQSVYQQLTDKKDVADTAKTILETQNLPAELKVKQSNAASEASNAAIKAADFWHGKPVQDPDTKELFIQIPNKNGQGYTLMPMAAATANMNIALGTAGKDAGAVAADIAANPNSNGTTINGVPAQLPTTPPASAPPTIKTGPSGGAVTGPTFQQKKQIEGANTELDHLTAQAQSAAPMKALVTELRNKDKSGIFSGGIAGTDGFNQLMNVIKPFLSPEQQATLARTQSWTADTGALVAQAVSQFAGARIAAREIDFFKTVKPDKLQTAEGREEIYQNLWRAANRAQQQAAQAKQHLDKGSTSLADFEPQFKDVPMPAVRVESLPNPKGWTGGDLQDDNGNTLTIRMGRWVNKQTNEPAH